MNNNLMINIGNKIKQRRIALGLSLQDVCDRIEVLGGSMHHSNLSRIESGKQHARDQTMGLILKALQCSLEELFMFTSSTNGISRATIGTRKLPLLHDRQVIDYIINNRFDHNKFVFTERNLSLKSFAFDITDDSMTPTFNLGDAIIIDPEVKPEPGDYVVAKVNEAACFRKYNYRGKDADGNNLFELAPLNNSHHTIKPEQKHVVEILGTMVEHRIFYKKK